MTSAINGSLGLSSPVLNQNKAQQTGVGKFTVFLQGQFKVGGLFGDFANALKLMNFWTESLTGAVTESSRKMTDAGSVIKNYIGVLEFPDKVASISKHLEGLSKGTAESVAEFANSIFGAGKSFFDGVELAGSRFGLLSKETVKTFAPLSPIGTFSFAANEIVLRNIPQLKETWSVNQNEARSNVLKLAKNVALLAVGSLALVATAFHPIAAPWVIPSLLTAYLTTSVAGRFFDGLVLPSQPKI